MRNPNGQIACIKGKNHPNSSMDFKSINPSEIQFMDSIKLHGI